MQFITLRPNIVMIDMSDKAHKICKSESIDTFIEKEIVPEYLKKFEL
jgi:diaminopimelate decarboxylase